MTRDEHKNIVNQLLTMVTPETQANASSLLTQLTEDYEKTLTEFETATDNVSRLTANNETLRSVNAELFLKVGTSSKDTNKDNNPMDKGNEGEGDEETLTFEALFNEKGDLI